MDGKFNPGQYRGRQTGGGGISGMFSKKPYMIPVNPHVTHEKKEEKVVVGQQVTPTAAVEERAKVELKDAIEQNVPHVSVKKTINRRKRKNTVISKAESKRATPKKKSRKNNTYKHKSSTRRKSRSKRHLTIEDNNNIFSKKRNWGACRTFYLYCSSKSGSYRKNVLFRM